MPEISIRAGGVDWLDQIEPLWQELRLHHAGLSDLFRESILAANFANRRAELIGKAPSGMLVLLAFRGEQLIGYCVSSIAGDRTGEVDSLFVTTVERGHGIGHEFMLRTLAWFQEEAVERLAVDVLSCNADALQFYARYGFVSRTTRLSLTHHPTESKNADERAN